MPELIPIDAQFAAAALPRRAEDGHKGTFGKLLIVGGSVGYTGAPYLAASAAVHSGCGLVYLGVPESIWQAEAVKCTSAMPFPLPDDGGMLCESSYGGIVERLSGCDVLALGPGLRRSTGVQKLVPLLLDFAAQSVVLDADGINALVGNADLLKLRRGRVTVLTPHEAEFSRLRGLPLSDVVHGDRAALAREFAAEYGCTLVLKGHRTVVALPDGQVFVNTCGGSELAKGGSGDILTGLIASLLCQGASARDAACCGVYLHARAGELLARQRTPYCVTPLSLIEQGFAQAFGELLK